MKLKYLISGAAVFAATCLGLFTVACSSDTSDTATSLVTGKVKHVWVITLENENYTTTFSTTTKSPYLANTLTAQGALLQNYYGTGHVSLDNYISMVSGQPGTPQTTSDCLTYADFKQTGTSTENLPIGTGCVYPAAVQTIGDQLKAANLTWKGYMGDMGNDPARESATCGHPTVNTTDMTQTAEAPSAAIPAGDQYATRHNGFMYFHSIIDSSDCGSHVVNLNNNLPNDLANVLTTANVNFITPSLCDDGHDAPCVDGRPGGLVSADAFLQKWIPIIMASPAYKADGLIVINFDESSYGSVAVSSSGEAITFTGAICCGQEAGPNLGSYPLTEALGPYSLTYSSYGGDNTGAVLLSPFIKGGTVSTVGYNHYSLLRSMEDIFGLTHLGYANGKAVVPFGSDIFTSL